MAGHGRARPRRWWLNMRSVELEAFMSSLEGRVLAACSGGPDSTVLMELLAPWHPFVAVVDHRRRPESAREAEAVVAHARALGLPATVLTLARPPKSMA